MKQEPLDNTCVNTRKNTGIDEPCLTPGNSAWIGDKPITAPEDMGLQAGLEMKWYCVGTPTTSAGYYMNTLTPTSTFTIGDVYFPGDNYFMTAANSNCRNYFGTIISGKVAVHEAGLYTFETTSDDGSRLYVNGDMLVDNWGLHGAVSRSGSVTLNKGYHDLKIEMFENNGGAYLTASYHGPDTENTSKLLHGFHKPE